MELLPRRVVVIALVTWLPLLLLAAVERHSFVGASAVTFLHDIETHARYLVALPLLLVAELMMHRRLRDLPQEFLERDLIPRNARALFDEAVASAARLRDSKLAEALLLALIYGVGILVVWRQYMALEAQTWYATPTADGSKLTLAGMWLGYVSLPIFQFLLLRWQYRLLIWVRFLWQVSRIRLNLVPTHPDCVGGLGLLASKMRAFVTLVMAHGALLAGQIAVRIFYAGTQLTDYKVEIILLVSFLLLELFGPMLFFSVQLEAAQRKGGREYGTLAQRYAREFDAKWLRNDAPPNEPLLGSADIQSLADMGNSFDVVRTMRLTPIKKEGVLLIVVATLLPIAPLVLTMMPLAELARKFVGIFL
ncbi:MAG TPA: hypothetical protein VFX90_04380 [Rhodoferax sp.]|nr:hypothetical protein [Rhodoferax sp.]